MTKYFVDQGGRYIGAFDGAEPPPGSIEVPSAPSDARQPWLGDQWGSFQKTAEQLREEYKVARAAAVAEIKVTTKAGNTFDGDEISQGRMARAVVALSAADQYTTVNWILADNSVIDATAAELTEALVLSGAAQAALWVQE